MRMGHQHHIDFAQSIQIFELGWSFGVFQYPWINHDHMTLEGRNLEGRLAKPLHLNTGLGQSTATKDDRQGQQAHQRDPDMPCLNEFFQHNNP